MNSGVRGLFFRKFGGPGPVCIILHGLLGSGENWQTMGKRLGESCTVYAPDLRNHGSSFHSPEMGYPEMAEDVRQLILEVADGPVWILGHSMGGKVGMELSLAYPDLVQRLVVVDISPFRYKPVYTNVFTGLKSLPIAEIKYRSQAEKLLEAHVPDRMIRLFLLKNLERSDAGLFSWKVNLEGLSDNYHKIWDTIDTSRRFENPVLFLEGEHSNAEIGSRFGAIQEIFPSAAYTSVKGAGHWIHSEKPEEFFQTVRGFFGF